MHEHSRGDFLAARMFHDHHPGGERIESYIFTTEFGANNIRKRASAFGLAKRIEDMLVVLPSPSPSTVENIIHENMSNKHAMNGDRAEMDISVVPKLMYDRFQMRIVNHDGGLGVLRAFTQAGALSQLHLTLGRQKSVRDAIADCNFIDRKVLDHCDFSVPGAFGSKVQYFFKNKAQPDKNGSIRGTGVSSFVDAAGQHAIPKSMEPVQIISDDNDSVTIVALKTNYKFDFYSD